MKNVILWLKKNGAAALVAGAFISFFSMLILQETSKLDAQPQEMTITVIKDCMPTATQPVVWGRYEEEAPVDEVFYLNLRGGLRSSLLSCEEMVKGKTFSVTAYKPFNRDVLNISDASQKL